MSTTIFDPALRDELRAYTRQLIKVIEAKTNIDLDNFVQSHLSEDGDIIESARSPKEQCKHYTYKGSIGIPCKNCRAQGSLYCAKHKKKVLPTILEYVALPEGEFLFDPSTSGLWTYNTREYVGKYLEGTIVYV